VDFPLPPLSSSNEFEGVGGRRVGDSAGGRRKKPKKSAKLWRINNPPAEKKIISVGGKWRLYTYITQHL